MRYKMQDANLFGVIIAGGRGKRFWPVSRLKNPKYFLKLPGQTKTLLQQAHDRLREIMSAKNILVITNRAQAAGVKRQLPQIPGKNIISEPVSKNSAAAIGLAATLINKMDPDAVMLVLPADQLIENAQSKLALKKALLKAAQTATEKDAIVTIGIRPAFASSSFGYIKSGKKAGTDVFTVDSFVEKPNKQKAKSLIKSKDYLWNSGIFVMKASKILDEIELYMPKLAMGLKLIAASIGTAEFARTLNRQYKGFSDLSIDYGIMEKSRDVYIVKSSVKWNDVGSWQYLFDILKTDKSGNVIIGPCALVDAQRSIIFSKKGHLVAVAGVKDLIIVHTKDATLVCTSKNPEYVKKLVEKIERNKMKGFL
ncbi:MAG: sugar phosphate nucleotidyltransferase [Candidatus Omnitrophota bacterium]